MGQMFQSVVITLDDGSAIVYSGAAQVELDTPRRVVNVKFTTPQELPPDCRMEKIDFLFNRPLDTAVSEE